MSRLPYATVHVAGIPLQNPAYGWRQREPEDAPAGMLSDTDVRTGGGAHGADLGRTIYRPGIVTVPVEVTATHGATEEARAGSYRDNLAALAALVGGTRPLEAHTGDGWVRTNTGAAAQPLPVRAYVPGGAIHLCQFTLGGFWRSPVELSQTWGPLEDEVGLDLTAWAGGTAPLGDLTISWAGPADALEVWPVEPVQRIRASRYLKYGVALTSGQTVTIDTDIKVATITASDPALIDYAKLSHPGSTSYLLEVPAGPYWRPPRVHVVGNPAEFEISGYNAWVSL